MAAGAHFGYPKFTFDRISGHLRSIRNFIFLKFLTKWLLSAILDVRNSLSIAFLAISDQYGILKKFEILDVQKSLLIAFLAISDRSAILDVWNSLSIAILAISDRYRILLVFFGGHFRCPKITFDHISGHFWTIGHIGCPKCTFDDISGHIRSIRILIFFLNFGQNGRRRPFWMSENNFRSQFLPFQIDTQLLFFFNFFDKMAAGGHFG